MVGAFDINPLRIEAVKREAGLSYPSYADFDQMIAEMKPDVGIVTTVDRFTTYIIRSSNPESMSLQKSR